MTHDLHLVLGVTSPLAVPFVTGQASSLRDAGFDVTVISSPGQQLEVIAATEAITTLEIPMQRGISPLSDCVSLARLFFQLRRRRPVLTDFGTPKAGLLGGIAAWLTCVPVRVYSLRGLRMETARGPLRALLWGAEWLACRSSHYVRCVSLSLCSRAINLRLVNPAKAMVVGTGPTEGIELARFLPNAENLAHSEDFRRTLLLPRGVPVVGFVGRLTRDKGIPELVEAYQLLRVQFPDIRLLLVGDFEDGDPVPEPVRHKILVDPNIVRTGFVTDAAPYYHLMDVLALPTYREGFPCVPLEAQAAGKPVITTIATGAIDSVQDGTTGLLVPVGDATALARAAATLLAAPARREAMGKLGQEWVAREFAAAKVRTALVHKYQELIHEKLGPTGRRSSQQTWSGLLKRAFDLVISTVGLVLTSPLFALVALVVLITMGRPVLFRDTRPGLHSKPFSLFKFRTMRVALDTQGDPLPDVERLTRVGIWLRKLSLDELPQLWNVLRGDMSLVGPRPLLMEYLPRYTPEQARRHEVMPGITGWTQVNGRNALTWEQKFEFDLWYVEHWSNTLDCRILLKTLWEVILRHGISSRGHATMPKLTDTAQAHLGRRS